MLWDNTYNIKHHSPSFLLQSSWFTVTLIVQVSFSPNHTHYTHYYPLSIQLTQAVVAQLFPWRQWQQCAASGDRGVFRVPTTGPRAGWGGLGRHGAGCGLGWFESPGSPEQGSSCLAPGRRRQGLVMDCDGDIIEWWWLDRASSALYPLSHAGVIDTYKYSFQSNHNKFALLWGEAQLCLPYVCW